jgi:myo-inositol-1(or 4)-monophosphatase
VAEDAARAAAAVHMRYRRGPIEFQTKNGNRRDLLTRADTEAEAAARAVLLAAFPGEPIIGEEDGSTSGRISAVLSDCGWLIDPLDGTFNFVHGFPDFSATVAFVEHGLSVAAATYAPVFDECFTAAQGLGATLNGERISVSPRRGLCNAIVNVSLGRTDDQADIARSARIRSVSLSQRTFGGTALVLAYVACGRFDLFYTRDNPRTGAWDIAAGALLVKEAGGIVTLSDGAPFRLPTTGMAAAADETTLSELRSLIAG